MRPLLILSIAFLQLFLPTLAIGADRAAGESHPLIGKWTWTRAENKCTEVYDFRTDGTVFVSSGNERSDNTFVISREPETRGFYTIKMKVVKDYGGKDCGDSEKDDTGQEDTGYILFEPSQSMYISCQEPSITACFGPLRRVTE